MIRVLILIALLALMLAWVVSCVDQLNASRPDRAIAPDGQLTSPSTQPAVASLAPVRDAAGGRHGR